MSWTTAPVTRPRPKVRGWIARVQIAAQAQGVGIASALTAVSGSTGTALGVGTPSASLTVRGLVGAAAGVGTAGASTVAVLRALADAEGLAAAMAAHAVLAEAGGVGEANAAAAVLAAAAVTGSGIAEAATVVRGVLASAAGQGAASAVGAHAVLGEAAGVGDAAAITVVANVVAAATGIGTGTAATFVRAVLAEAVATGIADASLIPTLAADTVGDGAADATAALGIGFVPISIVGVSPVVTAGTTTSTGAAAVTPSLPPGTAIGDRVFIFQSASNFTGSVIDPPWTVVYKGVQTEPTGTAPGAGTGRRYMSCYYQDRDAPWSMPSLALGAATQNSNSVVTMSLRKPEGSTWDAPESRDLIIQSTDSSSWSGTDAAPPDFWAVNKLAMFHTTTNDNRTSSSLDCRYTSDNTDLGTVTEQADGGTTTGNDVGIEVHTMPVAVGRDDETVQTTQTFSGSTQGNVRVIIQSASQ